MSDAPAAGGGKRRRRGGEDHEEHENHERWLITYADMITLLMVLFIVLFAMSSIDSSKYNALKASLTDAFPGQDSTVLSGSVSILDSPGDNAVDSIQPIRTVDSGTQAEIDRALAEAKRLDDQLAYQLALNEADRLRELEKRVLAILAAQGLDDDVDTEVNAEGLRISLVSRHIVFEANRAELTPLGARVIETVSPVLGELDNDLRIEGHTNQAAGRPKFFASDWDLASARAVTVLRLLNERYGVAAERLSAVGYGKTRPLLPVADPESQKVNKRVDVIVRTSLRSENESLLARAVAERAAQDASN